MPEHQNNTQPDNRYLHPLIICTDLVDIRTLGSLVIYDGIGIVNDEWHDIVIANGSNKSLDLSFYEATISAFDKPENKLKEYCVEQFNLKGTRRSIVWTSNFEKLHVVDFQLVPIHHVELSSYVLCTRKELPKTLQSELESCIAKYS